MKIKISKKDIVAINYSLIYVLDFDDFEILSGFTKKELREVIDKIMEIMFSDFFLMNDIFEIDFSDKEIKILSDLLNESSSSYFDNDVFWKGEKVNFEEISDKFYSLVN